MKSKIIIAIFISMLVLSCKEKNNQNNEKDSEYIQISKAQFELEKMTIGKPKLYPFADKVHFTGTITPTINGKVQISLPIPGFIEEIKFNPTQKVQKGDFLFEISGHWFIDLQKDFSESSAILLKLKSDYQRANDLYKENINSQKDFIAAESNYLAENAKHKALKIKLENIGLDVSKVEKGEFYTSFFIKSPISGIVSTINVSSKQFIEPQQIIAEIIDNNSMDLKLNVFEKDIHKIKLGQPVEFYLNGNKTQKNTASIKAIGATIMPESKSIECYATINKSENLYLLSNQIVEGDIITSLDSVLAVPETAIINVESKQYLLMLEKEENDILYFKKIKIEIGRKADNLIELNTKQQLEKILLNGAYNITIE